jgi:SAM-dependent methyltransferase
MTRIVDPTAGDRQVKARHRTMWASGNYPRVAAELIPALGPELVAACAVGAGMRVLDVGAGAGNAAIPAAQTGALVTAADLTPELLDVGRARAAEQGVELSWVEADAEALPFDTGEFDVVLSCVGAMFAPRHQVSADELVRVCRLASGQQRRQVVGVGGQDRRSGRDHRLRRDQRVGDVATTGGAEQCAGDPPGGRLGRHRAGGGQHPVHRCIAWATTQRLGQHDDRNP